MWSKCPRNIVFLAPSFAYHIIMSELWLCIFSCVSTSLYGFCDSVSVTILLLPHLLISVTLVPAPAEQVAALEGMKDAVVSVNPLSPLYHHRDIVPVFTKPEPVPQPKALLPTWVPNEDYLIRQGSGVFKKKTQLIVNRMAQLPAMPLPLPEAKANGPRTLQPDLAKGTSCERHFAACGSGVCVRVSLVCLGLLFVSLCAVGVSVRVLVCAIGFCASVCATVSSAWGVYLPLFVSPTTYVFERARV